MRWFGPAPFARICEDVERVETPVGNPCTWCREAMTASDFGFYIPYCGPYDGPDADVSHLYHQECFLGQILEDPSDGPSDLSLRQRALRAVSAARVRLGAPVPPPTPWVPIDLSGQNRVLRLVLIADPPKGALLLDGADDEAKSWLRIWQRQVDFLLIPIRELWINQPITSASLHSAAGLLLDELQAWARGERVNVIGHSGSFPLQMSFEVEAIMLTSF